MSSSPNSDSSPYVFLDDIVQDLEQKMEEHEKKLTNLEQKMEGRGLPDLARTIDHNLTNLQKI